MAKGKLRTVTAVSSGGVLFRPRQAGLAPPRGIEIVLVGQSSIGRWGLPKGAPSLGETLEQAALREVREETGMEGRIIAPLGHIEYWFGGRGVRYHKTVHFYLMEAIGGDTSAHDFEHDLVGWFPIAEAYALMSYANEREMVRRAEELLSQKERGFATPPP